MLCGTDPFPTDFRAKKYKLDKHAIQKVKIIIGFHENRISPLAIASGVASEEQIDIWEAITKLLMLTIAS